MDDVAGSIFLVGRIVFASVFVFSGVNHVANADQMREYARQSGFPVPALAPWPAGVWLLAGGVSVAAGIWGEIGTLMLIAFLIPAAVWFHPFWKTDDPQQQQSEMMLFFRNVAFIGACLALFAVFTSLDDGLRYAVTDAVIEID